MMAMPWYAGIIDKGYNYGVPIEKRKWELESIMLDSTTNKTYLYLRAQTNPQRGAFVYSVYLSEREYELLDKMLQDKRIDTEKKLQRAAAIIMKMSSFIR